MKVKIIFKLQLYQSKEDTSVRDKRPVKRRGRQRNTDCRSFQLPPSAKSTSTDKKGKYSQIQSSFRLLYCPDDPLHNA